MTDSDLPQTLPYHIADRIRRGIIRGRYPLGSNLREVDLGNEFSSSRGPIRESLRLLELQGLVTHSPRRGFRVRVLSKAELEHLYIMRAKLESVAIDILAQKSDISPLVAALHRSNEEMNRAAKRRDLDAYFDLNIEFHQMIIDACESVVLTRVLSTVNDMAMPIRFKLVAQNFPKSTDYNYHFEIVNSIEKRDFELAHKLTEEHILMIIPKVLQLPLEQQDDMN